MGKSLTLAVIGGDERQVFLASLALADGHAVRTFALDRANIEGAAICSDAASDVMQVLDAIPAGVPAFGGAVPFRLHARAVQCGVRLIDYLSREELAIRNAVPTCEGALQLAMEQTDCTIQGAHVLVIGAGRIGFLLAVRLHALGAQVTVAARSLRDRARIESAGLAAVDTAQLAQEVHGREIIFNTVPAPLLTGEILRALTPSCIVIDLASMPGGVAPDAVPPTGCRVIHALSLPGKVAPRTAAAAIYATVTAILREEGVL